LSKYTDILKQYWGYDSFRPLQDEIVESVGAGKDTLGLMPTGGGKSITFQVPALAREGLCIVVTPLIALMKDQVENLKKRGIKAAAIYSGMTAREIGITYDNCTFGDFKFLYLSPERIGTKAFLERLPNLRVSMLAIDESHCISQWGYDFRPSYLRIAEVREHLPDVPILAVTATATPEVAKDIQERLHFPKANLFQKSFERDNLVYAVRYVEDKERFVLKMLNNVPGTAIVYARSRKRTKEMAEFLVKAGIPADYYHAGLKSQEKDRKQKAWSDGSLRVIVATNAFGMGIDKPDVRLVVHVDLPDSLEAYFQEAGRAGRDGERAYAALLYSNSDGTKIKKRLKDAYPDKTFIKEVYDKVADYLRIAIGVGQDRSFEFDLANFCHHFKLNVLQTHSAIKILERAGYLTLSEERDNSSRLMYYDRYALIDFARNRKTEAVMKATLRTYTGLFTNFAYINEADIARQTGLSREEVYEALKSISDAKVGSYVPQNNTPLITFLQNRYDSKRLHIGKDAYENLQQRYAQRIKSVLDYATMRHRCRSQILLGYFGEEIKACGHCDVCLARERASLSNSDFETISAVIADKLSGSPLRIDKLIDSLPYDDEKTLNTLRQLLDDGTVVYNELQELVNGH